MPPVPLPAPPATLELRQLGCSKGGRALFSQVSATVYAGQWLYVAGANGVGKTSLLRMVCGLAPVDTGAIHWNSSPIHTQHEAYRQDLCYQGHQNALQESMTVLENLRFSAALAGVGGAATDTRHLQDVLARLGVAGRGAQLVRHLSQGQKRRVALARLALSPARLWVLDEPFVAMDDAGIGLLSALIAGHLAQGGLAVLTSHQQVPIGNIAPTVLELRA